jgi:hypothetical protein
MRSISALFRLVLAVMAIFLFAAGGLIFGRGVQDAVGIQVERDLDLMCSSRRGLEAIQPERTQRHVVSRHRALTLQQVNVFRRLIVLSCAKDL